MTMNVKGQLVRPIGETTGIELVDAMLQRALPIERAIIAKVIKECCIVSLDFDSAMKMRQVQRFGWRRNQ
jgi:hypothetical protein